MRNLTVGRPPSPALTASGRSHPSSARVNGLGSRPCVS
jgi:hypothetical protein